MREDQKATSATSVRQPVLHFLTRAIQAMLDRMSRGETEELRELAVELSALVADEGNSEYLGTVEEFSVRPIALADLSRAYLESANQARQLGLLNGARRLSWCKDLEWMYEEQAPVTARELIDVELFDAIQTANNFLRLMEWERLLMRFETSTSASLSACASRPSLRPFRETAGCAQRTHQAAQPSRQTQTRLPPPLKKQQML